jgi:hypothetical protein
MTHDTTQVRHDLAVLVNPALQEEVTPEDEPLEAAVSTPVPESNDLTGVD